MTSDKSKHRATGVGAPKTDMDAKPKPKAVVRKEALAYALRENLAKRKAQGRARAVTKDTEEKS